MPLSKYIVLGWGLSPYSKTDTIINIPNVQNGVNIQDTVSSSGGINVSTTTIAGSFRDFLKFGYSLNYYFGMIQEDWDRSFQDNENDLKDSIYYIKRKYKGYGQSIGILANIYKNTTLGIGYTSKSDLDLNTYAISGFLTNPEKLLSAKTASLPTSWRIGIFYYLSERLNAGMDLTLLQWEDAARDSVEMKMYNNTFRFGTGIRFIPSTRVSASFLKKLPISIGFRVGTLYYKSYPRIDTIFEKAVTFGIEIPFKGNLGSIITTFEYGTRGDKSKNGWDENIMSLGIALVGKIK